jgi:hypothetical protein
MKTILKRLWRDKVSLGVLILTIAFAIVGFKYWTYLLILYIFRGIMWEGKYIESLNKYVTDPKYRKLLGLDEKPLTPIMDIIFQVAIVLGMVAAAVYVIVIGLK